MHPDSVRVRVRTTLALIAALLVSPILVAQQIDVVDPHVRATDAFTPRGEAAPLPVSSFSVSHGIGIVTDDGSSYWPGYPSDLQAPATLHVTPTANNTFIVQRVPFQFDDPSTGVIAYDGAKRPIVGYLDANYLPPAFTLPTPFTFAGKQYTKLSISTWGAVAFGDADTTQVNYDPTVVSSMFHIQPIVAVWYELFNYTNTSRIITKNKPASVVITWQNVLSRHTTTPCTFQVELFATGEMNLSYQTLPIGDGLIGFSTGTETPTRQNAVPVNAAGLPAHLQVASASFDNYGGIIAGVTIKAGATIPAPASGESFRYTLMLNGVEAGAVEVGSNLSTSFVVSTPKIPEFPGAQINTWEVKLNGDTLSFRVPASSLEPYLNLSGNNNTWAIKSNRFGGAGFLEGTVTQTLPLTFSSRHSLLPSASGGAPIEVPAEVFHYMPGVWDTDRIRESIAAYLVNRGQNVDSFRFFPTAYDDGLKHSNYAGTYPRQKTVTGAGVIPARTECDCHYGAEFSALGESLANEGTTQVALTHELGHECVFYADYKDVDGTVKGPWRDAGVPCFGGAHPNNGLANPSMFADTESGLTTISVMGGSVAGTYSLTSPRFGYSRVEMYFMGLASPAEVTPIAFIQNGNTSQITIDQIIAANGPRTPAYVSGQTRLYRVPTFVVQRNGEGNIDAQVQQLQNVLWRWQSRFWRETGGRARANLTLDGSCSFTFSATSVMPAASPSTGAINVMSDAGCGWTSSSSDSWLTITSGGSGTGDGKLNYSIAANTSANPRTGTITIAGQPFTVTQLGTARRRSVGR
jgi:hypothetical protein